jgi:SH3 domain-containing YSC84-like protein 1
MKRLLPLLCVLVFGAAHAAFADETSRLQEAASVVRELRTLPEGGIPEDIWNRSECVVVIPSMKKAAFIFGGEYGKGAMSCRTANGWSAPVMMELAKGSWGLQIGAQAVDLVLMVMNRRGVDKMISNQVSLGADVSVAAGPVGRSASASTDATMKAEILSYSRASGVFAGINLSGGKLGPDRGDTEKLYGRGAVLADVLNGKTPAPTNVAATTFVSALGAGTRATTGQR